MMNLKMKQLLTAFAVSCAVMTAPVSVQAADKPAASDIEEGKKLAFSRSKGNCLACHMAGDGAQPGNIGPALVAMKLRYPDKQKLYNKVWGTSDSMKVPNSMMPEFGLHGILSDDEIRKVVDYIYTL
ncbi:sulfur oxidation c-type cytochrome SoxX [Thiomicrorhabdus xiamenensis]|uniref:Sulfur oxidation c-type cytochrome SoxX n=2 Tax=Thiomicrorhabdus xiamenensis TaxID=2739063 RepID=A0A7D4ST74_9GAMM|nr:sulfur oxidation c-type cytochrome SoxX [Thiomicrorhabdus xiamenensis]